MNHTPTPWKVGDCAKEPYDQIFDSEGTIVADLKWTKHTPTDRANNAAFIVTACNEHDRLVSENQKLRKALLAIVDNYRLQYQSDGISAARMQNARAALSK